MKWLDTYANHILHCSIFTGVATYSLKSASQRRSTSPSSLGDIPNATLSLVIGSIAAWNLYAEIHYMFQRFHLPPGDSGVVPILGHVIDWVTAPRDFLICRAKKYGGFPFTANILMTPNVIFSSDEDVRWLIAQERKGNVIPFGPNYLKDLMGHEVIMGQSSTNHRRLRRIFEPSFSPMAVKGYLKMIDDAVHTQLETWCATGDFCSPNEWAILAMRLFFRCAFGDVDEDTLTKFSSLFHRWVAGFTAWFPISVPGNCLYGAKVAKKELFQEIQKMIDDFKAANPPGSPGAEHDMMGRLCYGEDDDGNRLTDEQLTQNIRFIIFAGHDTTKGSFGSFAHFLVEFPELCDLLIEEVQTFSEPLNLDELKTAPLLNAFLAETWRMIPPVDSHRMEAITDLEYKGYKIKRGVVMTADITCDNAMNEDRFPDPSEFRVERWLPKDHPLHDPKYYLENVDYNVMSIKFRVFNIGAHMCLGAHFAKLEARVVLTRLLQKYDIQVRNDKLMKTPLLQYSNEFKLTRR